MRLVHPETGAPLGAPTREEARQALRETAAQFPDAYAGVLARLLLSDRDDFSGFLEAERARGTQVTLPLQAVCDLMAADIVTLVARLAPPAQRAGAALAFLKNLTDRVRGEIAPPAGESGEQPAAAQAGG